VNGRHWTPLEDGQLRRLYPVLPRVDLERFFQRRMTAIWTRAAVLGLSRGKWTEAEKAALRRLYPTLPAPDLERYFRRPMGAISQQAMKLGCQRRPPGGRFGPGHPTYRWNAGKKIGSRGRTAETQFKPRQISNTWVPIGTVVIDTEGYRKIKVSDDRTVPSRFNWRFCHVLLWERHRGPVPRGHVVTFRDGDRSHIRMPNLELITRRELRRRNSIHALYPPELKAVIYQLAGLKHRITIKERKLRHAQDKNAGGPPGAAIQRRRTAREGGRRRPRGRVEARQGHRRDRQGADRNRQA